MVADSYAVYEIGEDGGRTLVADGLKPADVLADGIDVTVNDTAAHRYEVVGSANVPEGADAVTVTYTATLAAVEEPEPGPDPDPTPDPSEKPDGDGTGDGTGAGTRRRAEADPGRCGENRCGCVRSSYRSGGAARGRRCDAVAAPSRESVSLSTGRRQSTVRFDFD